MSTISYLNGVKYVLVATTRDNQEKETIVETDKPMYRTDQYFTKDNNPKKADK